MKFSVAICKRGRKCHFCSGYIQKQEKFFQQTYWTEGEDYPTKKNVCLKCLRAIADDSFLAYLKEFVAAVELRKRVGF